MVGPSPEQCLASFGFLCFFRQRILWSNSYGAQMHIVNLDQGSFSFQTMYDYVGGLTYTCFVACK
jgi:hypothetical protein